MSATWVATQAGPGGQHATLVGCQWAADQAGPFRLRSEAQEAAEDHVCDREALT